MFKKRSQETEILDHYCKDSSHIPIELLQKNLKEFRFINYWLGTRACLLNAMNKIFHQYSSHLLSSEIIIADLGCGAGDLIPPLYQWAQHKQIKIKVVALDDNAEILNIARKNTQAIAAIDYKILDVLTDELRNYTFNIVCLNNVCHHFTDTELVRLLMNLKKMRPLAIVINDLKRHPISYYFIKWTSKLFKLSELAQHDGPLSVLKAFKKQDLINILKTAQITDFSLTSAWGFRWQLIIWDNHLIEGVLR